MNAMLLRMPRTRRRRISFAMNVRSTIAEARYPTRVVIMAAPLLFVSYSRVVLLRPGSRIGGGLNSFGAPPRQTRAKPQP